MFTLHGPAGRYCDGQSRRSFLKIGGLAMGGLGLPGLLRAEDAAGKASPHKSVIMVYLSGGLSHHDTFDLKPNAPAQVRGEFNPIATRIPGVQFGDLLPRLSASADKLAIIRSLVGQRDEHSSFQSLTGTSMDLARRENKPHFGAVVSRLAATSSDVVPPFVDLFPTMQHKPYNSAGPGFLGTAHAAAKLDGGDLSLMSQTAVAPERFSRRLGLLEQFDNWRREADSAAVDGMDRNYRRALDVLTTNRVAKALDVTREDPRLRDRYGIGSAKHLGDGAPMWNDQLLMARRLVEAGARVVTVAYGFWDTHGDNAGHLKRTLPLFDAGISALIEDIHARGLDKDVTVVVWGEFGRTPKINDKAGRDHWAPVNHAIMAGGGMKVGQVIGATDKLGAYVSSTPIHYLDVLATAYHNLGIDPHTFVEDPSGRPISILPATASPIARLM